MIFQSPGPIITELGPLTLRWYGLCMAIAFITCLYFAKNLAVRRWLTEEAAQDKELVDKIFDELVDFGIVAIVSGIIGARLWFVLLEHKYFFAHPTEIVQIWLGGQSIQGGLIGAFVGTFVYEFFVRDNSYKDFLEKLAVVVAVTPLGQALGRFGNFFNEEAFGRVTELPWKLYISHTGEFHHPTFAYEAILNLGLFFLLTKFTCEQRLLPHKIIALYLMSYSVIRLLIEPLRTDSLYIGAFPAATVLSVIALGIGLVIWIAPQKSS